MENSPLTSSNFSIILFDGECNFCSRSVLFIIRRDGKGHFRFASLQSNIAKHLVDNRLPIPNTDSIVLIEKGEVFTESSAVLRICKRLDGFCKFFYIFIIVPKPLRDVSYRWFAKHRYHFFGKQSACIIPTAEIRQKFLDITQQKGSRENE